MNFLIVRSADVIAIDNAILSGIDCSSLASNVTTVIWDGKKEQGEIEYNDRPPLREPFSDPSPYFVLLNSWMTAMAAAALPLTATQARAIKGSFVDALFDLKRTTAVTFSGHTYDVSDESLDALKTVLLAVLPGDIIATLSAAINTVTGAGFGSDSGGNNQYPHGTFLYVINQLVDSGSVTTLNPAALNSPLLSTSAIVSWVDVNAITTSVDAIALLAAIASRRATLQALRVAKKAALAGLGTVAAVVAYDITAGW